MPMDLQDLERLQALYPEYQVELIAGPELFPGWGIAITRLWPAVYE